MTHIHARGAATRTRRALEHPAHQSDAEAQKVSMAWTQRMLSAQGGQPGGLAQNIRQAIQADSGPGTRPWSPTDPESGTLLQRLLAEAVYGLPRSELLASPALLSAVQAGFQTEGGRQFALDANVIEAVLVGDLSQPLAPAGHAQPRRRLMQADHRAEVDATFVRGAEVPPEQWAPVEKILYALAEESPDFRNVMARARALNRGRRFTIVVDGRLRGARLNPRDGAIELPTLADPRRAASLVVFEANNGALVNAFARRSARLRQRTSFTPALIAQLDPLGARMLAGGLRRDPAALAAYVEQELHRPPAQSILQGHWQAVRAEHPAASASEQWQLAVARTRAQIANQALTRPESLIPYIERTFDTPEKRLDFYAAVEYANDFEVTEMDTALNHHRIFENVLSKRQSVPPTANTLAVLDDTSLQAMDFYQDLPHVQVGTLESARTSLYRQIDTGHSMIYLEQGLKLRGQPPLVSPPPGAEDPPVEVVHESEGAEAGQRVRASVDAAVDAQGPKGDPVAARATVEASLRKESLGLAERILASPEMAGVVKVLGVAATAAMVAQLAEAIYTDVSHGDHEAHATRKVLAELAGGLVGADVGAGLGAWAGAAIGSLVLPGAGTAVGFFVGGLFGSLAGFAVGAAAGDAAYGFTRKPIDALIDRLMADGGPSPGAGVLGNLLDHPERHAARLITAGSSHDAQVNAGELLDGLQAFGYRVDGSDDKALGRLIDAYDAGGDGALTAQELAAAIRDKALVVQPDGQVTLDATRYVSRPGEARWRTQAGHIAGRWIGLDTARHEGAGDGRINASELADSLHASGYRLAKGTDEAALSRVLNAYDRFGQGAVSQADLTNALSDGALVIDAEGGVSVDGSRIRGLTGGQAANIALRLVQADEDGSDRDGWLNAEEIRNCLQAVGYEPQLSEADCEALVARFGADGLIGAKGLQQAIGSGVLAFDANGTVTRTLPELQLS
ncbi:MAG: hypothetical protein V4739_06905 [Pseudomonadota bacterium]